GATADALAVAYFTLTGTPLAFDRCRVKLRAASASLRLASAIDRDGDVSSSLMVPTPRLSEIVAAAALDRLRSNVSSASSSVSPLTGTRIVFDVSPGTIV